MGQSLIEALQEWGLTTFGLSVKIFVIIICILTLLEILKTLDLISPMVRALSPLLKIMGLRSEGGVSLAYCRHFWGRLRRRGDC